MTVKIRLSRSETAGDVASPDSGGRRRQTPLATIVRLARLGAVVGLIPVFAGLVLASGVPTQGTADYMHRRHGLSEEDALIKAFKGVLVEAKAGDWNEIARTIGTLSPQMDRYQGLFNVDAKSKLDRSIAKRDAGTTVRYLAQVVYLGMKEQFHLILDSQMRDVVDAKARLERAKEYYDDVLAGNVKRRALERHERIEGQFVLAEAALGNPAIFIDLPVMESDLHGFEEATQAIEREVRAVYTYFDE
jgi:hypothetical protein